MTWTGWSYPRSTPRVFAPVTGSTGRPLTVRNAKSRFSSDDAVQPGATVMRWMPQPPSGAVPSWYSGTKARLPGCPVGPLTQCAAVSRRLPAGLCTTLAVQKCRIRIGPRVKNNAPTVGTPVNDVAVGVPGGGSASAVFAGPELRGSGVAARMRSGVQKLWYPAADA